MTDDAATQGEPRLPPACGGEPDALQAPESVEPASPAKRPVAAARVALAAGLITVLALAGLAGWLGFRAVEGHNAEAQRNLFVDAARQGAMTLTTLDYEHADADVQRILNSATGAFYDNLSHRWQPLIDIVKQGRSKLVGTVTEAALESQTGDDGRVLVAMTVKAVNPGGGEQEPQAAWRMRITVHKQGGGAKLSHVAFVS